MYVRMPLWYNMFHLSFPVTSSVLLQTIIRDMNQPPTQTMCLIQQTISKITDNTQSGKYTPIVKQQKQKNNDFK